MFAAVFGDPFGFVSFAGACATGVLAFVSLFAGACAVCVLSSGTLGVATGPVPPFDPELLAPELRAAVLLDLELLNAELRDPELRDPELLAPELLASELRDPELLAPELLDPELLCLHGGHGGHDPPSLEPPAPIYLMSINFYAK